MFEVVLTFKPDFREEIFAVTDSESAAKTLAQHESKRRKDLFRTYWRSTHSVLENCLYETERQLIEEALKKLSPADLTEGNLGTCVERVIVQAMEQGGFPWADPDMAATAIAKLKQLSPGQMQKVLVEFYGKKD